MKNKNSANQSRRKFIHDMGLAALSIHGVSTLIGSEEPYSEEKSIQRIKREKADGKLGIALVGLGSYAGGQLAPALLQTQNCFLAGIVTGTPQKAEDWKTKYSIPSKNIYDYRTYDKIKDNPDIDIIYVVLPNSMHREYVIRGAATNKHIICEKPMALTVADCDAMIAAVKKTGKTLSIGYRLNFEPYNLEMAKLGSQKIYGDVKKITAGYAFTIGDPTQWRLKKDMAGGGPLMDLGIYCLQAHCYTSGSEPLWVTAQEGEKTDLVKFKEVEQSLTWQFGMANGTACEGRASYADGQNFLRAEAEKGWFELTSAYNYRGQRGGTSDKGAFNFTSVNQQAVQMDGICQSIKDGKKSSIVPGEMGRRDVKILNAIYEAMKSGKKVAIAK